jgi:quercetin 2,3-dioxygenase
MTARTVTSVTTAHHQLEGGGFLVRRPFPTRGLPRVDPFLMLDEMGPVDYGPGEAVGAPDHPHRGFETVTYVLEGAVEHEDSAGHKGRIGPGDVQWMTAGAGVVHSEMPSEDLRRSGGRMHGFQLWVNLPAADKMIAPRYQEYPSAGLPVATSDDGLAKVKVIAGQALGVSAVIETRTPILYQHWSLKPGADVVQGVPSALGGFVYVFGGEATIAGRTVGDGQLAQLGGGDSLHLSVAKDGQPTELLLLAGAPIEEPVVQWGPFVMNTGAEIQQAIVDYQTGRMGRIER